MLFNSKSHAKRNTFESITIDPKAASTIDNGVVPAAKSHPAVSSPVAIQVNNSETVEMRKFESKVKKLFFLVGVALLLFGISHVISSMDDDNLRADVNRRFKIVADIFEVMNNKTDGPEGNNKTDGLEGKSWQETGMSAADYYTARIEESAASAVEALNKWYIGQMTKRLS